jgi:hypothetical protein
MPSAISTLNEHNEQAILISILPDLRQPKIRNRFLNTLKKNNPDKIDTDS